MDTGSFPSSDFLERLLCSHCKNHLSYFPIFLSPNMKHFCGRCYMTPRHGERYRNEAYETIAQFLKFPCRYKNNGCSEELLPKDIPKHEEVCSSKPMKCPSKCFWEGPLTELLGHYQEKHNDVMLVNNQDFQMDLINFPQQEKFLEYKNMLFTSSSKFDSFTNILEWAIYQTGNENAVENFPCELKVTNKKRTFSLEIDTTNSWNITYTRISLECLKEESKNLSVVLGNINFEKIDDAYMIKMKNLLGDIVTEAQNKKIDTEMLSAIKCFMCSNYVTPPIFECFKEEAALCLNCQNKHVQKCEFCRKQATIKNTNISLDKIAMCLNYPCKYQQYGCPFIAKHDEITKHHELCPHKLYFCPVRDFIRCKWRGELQEVSDHLLCSHEDTVCNVEETSFYMLYKKNEVDSKAIMDNQIECDLLEYEGRIFRLTYTREEQAFYFVVQMVDNFDQPAKYEIKIFDKTEGRRLLMRKPCPPLCRKALLFSNNDHCCFFTLDQVAPFLCNDDRINFDVKIFTK